MVLALDALVLPLALTDVEAARNVHWRLARLALHKRDRGPYSSRF